MPSCFVYVAVVATIFVVVAAWEICAWHQLLLCDFTYYRT